MLVVSMQIMFVSSNQAKDRIASRPTQSRSKWGLVRSILANLYVLTPRLLVLWVAPAWPKTLLLMVNILYAYQSLVSLV